MRTQKELFQEAAQLPSIQSPLNYIGGKYRLLPQLLPHFPRKIDFFLDLFCGGGNVGINVNARKIIFNDNNANIINLLRAFRDLDKRASFEFINDLIDEYALSRSEERGYDFYGCDSYRGLGDYNRDKFIKLRDDFNQITKNEGYEYRYYMMLYVLIIYSFNNQVRFNGKGEFNLPVGKRDFNSKMQAKLSVFIDRLKEGSYKFTNDDFREVDISYLTKESLIYADPPYLIACATYNEGGGWGQEEESALLMSLDSLHSRGIKFALSNVLSSKGKQNDILLSWLEKNSKYKIIHLDYNYSNSNYQTKDKTSGADEVLIVNWSV